MSTYRLSLKDYIKKVSPYNRFAAARDYIPELLQEHATIEVDLEGVNLTPSLADEVIGLMAHLLYKRFKERVKILNATESQKALLKHVVARRVSSDE